jgi:hypothetical protein
MKEWIMKHPILTFLLADSLICGVLNTIRSFAPKNTAPASEETTEEVTIEEEEAE